MKQVSGRLKLLSAVGALLILAIIATIIWYQRTEPLMDDGLTVYQNPDSKIKFYTMMIVNKSNSTIDIQRVTVNGEKIPDNVQLGITFDSGRLVQYLGDETYPATKMMNLHDASILPQLPVQEIGAIIASEVKKHTPIHYGIVVRYDQEAIQEMTIRFTYLGFTKTKRITKWFANETL
ncbi:hypothetical protein [Paenibacillus paeoniae]|uniref:Uncharacterized protein n=1 Tax=Paenibacillus paeoniae TaxID=2292705 RepID=A0A371PI87_9BACL|nr:hypothetical protein [Paenibacillus paeoniae]REK75090.1 hypothetical protein DX130_15780 [Paenibacillus paeoniae]